MDGLEWARSKWSWPARIWLKLMEAIAMWTPNRVIADSEAILDHLRERHTYLPPATFIPYGARVIETTPQEELLQEWDLKSQSYLLIVCRLEPENHLLEIIKGYQISSATLPLVIVGSYFENTKYAKALMKFSSKNIRFVGSVFNQDKLIALRYHSYAYLHGHSVGGTNPSLLEAMGCGNRIIAHDNKFNREVASGSAMYFSDANSLSAILSNLKNCPANGRAAQDIIIECYTWDSVVSDYLNLLAQYKSV
jgi:glycosyltransferase involved in cell wall biosynthesis